ncbi:SusD/RagB family nutrient-binding outer membrane lipoprotein [Deminuibacter soli]|uniref:SusD/RagB family nutrient-binding outer membrane lipoprotein n=1 Tax=Deminuibacter soli TaxID=2291815 RepID=A0A3E1NE22_9BACT|nr:SusD/RagB family nutrient-binding outer membrane lipoprotein [Deminuibacter soli]RFM26028.1 SusD/RagB family nutrient-binding outer membrane lipoprotein [Deminuibacter soli]
MKKLIYRLLLLPVMGTVVLTTSCKKSFDSLNSNPNVPTTVQPSLLLNGVLFNMYDAPYTMKERWGQYYCCNYDYYGNNKYDFGGMDDYYNTLKNVQKMEAQAIAYGGEAVNPYEALGKFFRAYFFTKMSLEVGDLPMNDALKGEATLTPKYNTQKEIFIQAFKWLDSANTDLGQLASKASSNTAEGQTLKGDFYFGSTSNPLAQWQKVVNAYRLRLLINLSIRVADADLNIKQQFADIINNPGKYPLLQDANDNLQFLYIAPTNLYPNNKNNFGNDALRYNTSGTYIGLLTSLKDPRVFVTAEPATAKLDKGIAATSFDAFVGADPGEDLGDMYKETNAGVYSLLNRKRYYDGYTGEPSIQVGYAEQCFNIAEAINRGWISGNAESYYKTGMLTSLAFYGIPQTGSLTVYFLKRGASLGTYDSYTVNTDFAAYYGQPTVAYAGNNPDGLKEILLQKYLALFRHSGLEAYYQNRRTQIPVFTTGPGTGNSERIPKRFQYPSAERSANTTNYTDALKNQYSGNDDINGTMWLLKSN